MTKSELIEYLEFKADLEREMARQLANWSPTEKPTPTNNLDIKESPLPNVKYITGTITNVVFHKSNTGSKNNVSTVYVKLDNDDQEKIYNVTYNSRCRYANWKNFYDPLRIVSVTKDSTIEQQEKVNLNRLIGQKVSVELVNGKIKRFVTRISDLEQQINNLLWDDEIED